MVDTAPSMAPTSIFVTGRFKKFDAISGKCEIELNLKPVDRHAIVEMGGTLLRFSIESAQPALPLFDTPPSLPPHPYQSEPIIEGGQVVGSKCAACDLSADLHAPMADHLYTPPTPMADGVIYDSCFTCDLSMAFHYSPTDHVWQEITSVREDGGLLVKCGQCDLPRGVHPDTLPDQAAPDEGGDLLAA